MNADEKSEVINLLKQIKEQGDVDDSLAAEIEVAIGRLEVEGNKRNTKEQLEAVLNVLADVFAVLPEIKSVIDSLTSFFDD